MLSEFVQFSEFVLHALAWVERPAVGMSIRLVLDAVSTVDAVDAIHAIHSMRLFMPVDAVNTVGSIHGLGGIRRRAPALVQCGELLGE